jgi:hypothetical protein
MAHSEKTPKLRPRKSRHGGETHGVYYLAELLKGDLDGRLKLKKDRDRLEAQLIDHCGGLQALTPPMMMLIRRVAHKELIAAQIEKMSLLGECDLSHKNHLALTNSLRLDLLALEGLLKGTGKVGKLNREAWLKSVSRE